MVASECEPFAKTGGLADVVDALSRALGQAGHEVDVYLPRYRGIDPPGDAERLDLHVPTPFGEVHSRFPTGARFSPDGQWVAYASAERGTRTTIYVQPFPPTGAKYQLVAKGFDAPHELAWSPDGKELLYNPGVGRFEAVSVRTQPTFAFGNAVAVPRPFRTAPTNSRTLYDITPGGKFVGLIPAGQTEFGPTATPQIQVVLNWFEELRARVPPPK
jgi:hypothetical protein